MSLEEARQLGHNYIGTEHLLLGLVREGEGVAARVLENLRVDLSKVRTKVIRMLDEKNILDDLFFRQFTKKVIQCLVLSSHEASNLKQTRISLEIIFLGLIRDKTSVAAKFLNGMGITLENATNIIEKRLNSRYFSSEELMLLEFLLTSTKKLNLELCKAITNRENAEVRNDFDMASQLQERENEIKKRISSLEARIAPDTWGIFENIFVKEAWEIKLAHLGK